MLPSDPVPHVLFFQILMRLLSSIMTSLTPGPATQAWLEAGRKTSNASSKRMLARIGLAVFLYAVLQVSRNLPQVWETGSIQAWDTTLGIDHADASAIVGALAAVVFAINIAVFAARIGQSTDLRAELDLARWQRKMELLAPLSAVAALVVAGTRMPTEVGLGLVLLTIAVITLAAADVRIAGRLGTLEMEAGAAQAQLDEVRKELNYFRGFLPDYVTSKLPPKLSPSDQYLWATLGYIIASVALKFLLAWETLLALSDAQLSAMTARNNDFGYLIWTTLATLVALVLLCLLSVLKMTHYSRGPVWSSKSHPKLGRVAAFELSTVVALLLFEGLTSNRMVWLQQCLASFAICLVFYLCLRFSFGPGKCLSLRRLAQLTERCAAAELRAAAAVEELSSEKALHAALMLVDKVPTTATRPSNSSFIQRFISR